MLIVPIVLAVVMVAAVRIADRTAGAVAEYLRAIVFAASVVGFFRLSVAITVCLVHAVDELLNKALKVRTRKRRDKRQGDNCGEPCGPPVMPKNGAHALCSRLIIATRRPLACM